MPVPNPAYPRGAWMPSEVYRGPAVYALPRSGASVAGMARACSRTLLAAGTQPEACAYVTGGTAAEVKSCRAGVEYASGNQAAAPPSQAVSFPDSTTGAAFYAGMGLQNSCVSYLQSDLGF